MGVRFRLSLMIAAMAIAARSQPYPPPGRMFDIGGRQLHLDCAGKGAPTVVLVAGGGAYSIDWQLVQPRIAQQTRVCSYDRAGLGWSDPGPADETVEQTVADLHSLLGVAGETGPFVLVGASIGGIYIRGYHHAYPGDVAALVFTNSSSRVGFLSEGKGGLIWDLSEEELRSGYPLPAANRPPRPTREGEPFDRLPPDLQAIRLWLDIRFWEKSDPARATADSLLSWRREFRREFDQMDPRKPALGTLPVVVVSSQAPATVTDLRKRDAAGPMLDFLSANSVHITAAGSGHEIHLYQPDTVVQGIERAVASVRGHRPLANR
jgi:pimeloyl-ACP methyl ester carboxylesterase